MPDNKIWLGGKLVGVLVSILFGSRMSRWSETEDSGFVVYRQAL